MKNAERVAPVAATLLRSIALGMARSVARAGVKAGQGAMQELAQAAESNAPVRIDRVVGRSLVRGTQSVLQDVRRAAEEVGRRTAHASDRLEDEDYD